MIPFCYVLMTHKTTAAYTHIFRHIHEELWSLDASMFMTDYELAMRNAIRGLFPNADHRCCWFHFCQVILFLCHSECVYISLFLFRPSRKTQRRNAKDLFSLSKIIRSSASCTTNS